MPDNVNITVNETIENVVINPSISTDVIDVNIAATTENVTIDVTPNLTTVNINTITSGFYVPYTGATQDVDLGLFDITAAHLIKDGGQSSQFLKADGSVDNNVYLTSADLPSTLDLYATTTASDIVGYTVLVRNISDSRFNTIAVDVSTGVITTTGQLVGQLVTDANIISGNPGVFNITTIGNISRTSGTGQAEFYFRVYKRTSAGVETFITESDKTLPVTNGGYTEFSATALWNDGIFTNTDRVVLKYYADRLTTPTGSNPVYRFQFGGISPVRSTAAIPTSVMPNIYLRDLADVENVDALNNEVLYWNDADSLWEHSSVIGLLSPASSTVNGYLSSTDWTAFNSKADDNLVVHKEGTETITGAKTFNPSVTATSSIARGTYLTPSLIASAANDGLYAIDVNPSFSNSAFTGVTNNGIRITTSTNRSFGGLLVANTASTGVSTTARIQVSSNAANFQLSSTASSYSTFGMTRASSNLLYATVGSMSIISADSFISLGTGASGGTEGFRMFNSTRNILIQNGGTFTDNGYKLDINGTQRVQGLSSLNSVVINNTVLNASAVLQADSTTKGFLPPRMTNAQRIAIAYPAIGLCVYCTDTIEGLYINKSTGWTYIG